MSEQASSPARWGLDPVNDRGRNSRVSVSLACSECKARNYRTTKAPGQLLEFKKFCKQCKKHTLHRETK